MKNPKAIQRKGCNRMRNYYFLICQKYNVYKEEQGPPIQTAVFKIILEKINTQKLVLEKN